jgi:hypothetical protein
LEGSGSDKRPAAAKFFQSSLVKVGAIFFFGYLIYRTNYAPWALRLTLCMLFCSMIYARDDSPSGRWIAIGIIAVGTLLAILLPLAGIELGGGFRRSAF